MVKAQQRAVKAYRKRLTQQGMARFDVLALSTDRELIRSVARRLAEGGFDATQLRADIGAAIAGPTEMTGTILAALRRSPLVGADLDLTRTEEAGRPVDL